MSTYKITAVRSKEIPWSGGTFKKYEVKTDKTGDKILTLQFGDKKNAKVQMGNVVEGYLKENTFNSKSGPQIETILKPVDAAYVLDLLKKIHPDIETIPAASVNVTINTSAGEAPDDGFGGESTEEPGF